MTYRVHGRDPNKPSIIIQEVKQPEPVATHRETKDDGPNYNMDLTDLEDWLGSFKFYLSSKEYGSYYEKGQIRFFKSKNEAKKTRNKLNKKYGSGAFLIAKIEHHPMITAGMGFII